MTYHEIDILKALSCTGINRTMPELSEWTYIPQDGTTTALESLKKRGYVELKSRKWNISTDGLIAINPVIIEKEKIVVKHLFVSDPATVRSSDLEHSQMINMRSAAQAYHVNRNGR